MNLSFKDGFPEEKQTVIIKYSINKEDQLPFELGSGYYYNNSWWINFYTPTIISPETYKILGWTEYNYDK